MLEQDKKEQLFGKTIETKWEKVKGRNNKHREEEIVRRDKGERERGWEIWNGNMEGNKKRELTYISTGHSSAIDYTIRNIKARDKVNSLVVEERIGLFANVYIKAENLRQSVLEREKNFKDGNFKQQIWTEKEIKNFREILETRKFEKIGLEDS